MPTPVLRRKGPAVLTVGLSLFAACTTAQPEPSPGSTAAAFAPEFAEEACPADVEVTLLVDHSCGYLTVLQDRSRAGGATVRLLVVRMDPPGAVAAVDPMLVAGADIGDEPHIGSFAPLAARVQRTIYVLEPRGVGHSEPELTCPEIEELAVEVVESPFGDETVREHFLDAVAACRARLVADGVEIGSFGVTEAAADIEDLRQVLDIPRWNLVSYGSNSRFVLESVRRFPDGVRAVAIDSPEFPQFGVATGPEAFASAVSELSVACSAQPECASAAPDVEALLETAVARLDARPLEIEVTDGARAEQAGGAVLVRLDGATALRAVRFALGGDGPVNATQLPAAIAAAAAEEPAPLFARILANDPVLCAGYRPLCRSEAGTFSLGVYLSVLCGDPAPILEQGDSPNPRLFEDNPYLAACERWDIPPGDASIHEPLATDLPVLIMTGTLDSFSAASAAEDAAASLPNALVLEAPGQTHNVLGFSDCTLAIRNAWIDEPGARPDTACLEELTITFEIDAD